MGDSEPVEATYNPTASLAGFALLFSRIGSRLHEKAETISSDALEVLLGATAVEVHELSCFLRLLDCIVKTGTNLNIDLTSVERKIGKLINESITRDTRRWKTEYVCRPSRFFRPRTDRFFPGNEKIASFECKFLEKTKLEDGSWPVAWSWAEFPSEWPVAKEWWKSAIVIENLLFLKNFEDETEA